MQRSVFAPLSGVDSASRGCLAMSEGILTVILWDGGSDTGIWWAEARATDQHPVVHRTAPTVT